MSDCTQIVSLEFSPQCTHSASLSKDNELLAAMAAQVGPALAALEQLVHEPLPAAIRQRIARIGIQGARIKPSSGHPAQAFHKEPDFSKMGVALAKECYQLAQDIEGAMGEEYVREFTRRDADLTAACRQWGRTADALSEEAFSRFLQTTKLPGKYLVEAAGSDNAKMMLIVKHLVNTSPLIAPDVLQHSDVRQACRQWGLALASDLAPAGSWQRFMAQLSQAASPEFVLALTALAPSASRIPAPPELIDHLSLHAEVADRARALTGPLAGVLDMVSPMHSLSSASGKSILYAIAAPQAARSTASAAMS